MLTRNRDRIHAFACALSFIFAGIPAVTAAHAGSLEKAVETVKNASDEDLRDEVERRIQKRRRRATESAVGASRGVNAGAASGLASLDDAQLLTAAHVASRSIYGIDDRKDRYRLPPATGLSRSRARPLRFSTRPSSKRHPAARFASRPSPSRMSGTFARRPRKSSRTSPRPPSARARWCSPIWF